MAVAATEVRLENAEAMAFLTGVSPACATVGRSVQAATKATRETGV